MENIPQICEMNEHRAIFGHIRHLFKHRAHGQSKHSCRNGSQTPTAPHNCKTS